MISEDSRVERFIDEHRWAVLTTLRESGSPVSAVVAFARDGDQLLVSTRDDTFRARSLARDERVNLCILSNREPFSFVAVEGAAAIETEDLVPATRKVFDAIADTEYQAPPDLAGWIEADRRVILRITPLRVFSTWR
jgi:PPOX class probable F420-dependent enzyme